MINSPYWKPEESEPAAELEESRWEELFYWDFPGASTDSHYGELGPFDLPEGTLEWKVVCQWWEGEPCRDEERKVFFSVTWIDGDYFSGEWNVVRLARYYKWESREGIKIFEFDEPSGLTHYISFSVSRVEFNITRARSPVSYIQRVGRIWRLGQKEKELYIHNFLPQFEVERRVMEVILEKIQRIKEDFGEIGLSVFGEELGSIDKLVQTAYSKDIKEQVDRAEEKSLVFGQEIIEQIMGSMELPKVVNVEDLQRNNLINIDDSFSEEDLLKFLEHLKDAGVASGSFSDDKKKESTYYVRGEKEYTQVLRLSLDDEGIKQAIATGKSLQRRFDFHFTHRKEMEGILSIFRFKIDDKIVYEEPVLVTSDGVLTYQGIRDLAPSFVKSYSTINFRPLEIYKSESAQIWLEIALNKFYEEAQFREQLYSNETDPFKREALKNELKKCIDQRPQKCIVEEGEEICRVGFKKMLSETALIGNEEVEKFGMEKAIEYYESIGYYVEDVHLDFYKGYDIECKRANSILRVEVKGLKGSKYPLMTPNEHSKAILYREGYVLFIVVIRDKGYSLYAIPDPVYNKVDIIEISKPVYQVKGYDAFQVQ